MRNYTDLISLKTFFVDKMHDGLIIYGKYLPTRTN